MGWCACMGNGCWRAFRVEIERGLEANFRERGRVTTSRYSVGGLL